MNKHTLKVLIVTSDRKFYRRAAPLFGEIQGKLCETEWRKAERTALREIKSCRFDVCFIDSRFERNTGLKLLQSAILTGCRTPLVLLINEGEENFRIEAIQAGAAFCLTREKLDVPLLEKVISYTVERVGNLSHLRENVAKFRQLVETLPVMVYVAEAEPPYSPIYVSPAFETFGYDLDEWKESEDFWMRLIHSQDRERVLRETDEMMRAGKETDLEYRVVDKRGAVRWVHDRGRFARDETGKLICWQGIIIDITEQKQTEQAVLANEEKYRLLGEGIMHQVWTARPNGKLDYVNNRTIKYFGKTFEQMIGDGWQTVVHPDDLDECLKCWSYSLETGADYEAEFRLRRNDGEYRWHQARATAGLDADGRIVKWFGTNTDINNEKIAEERLHHIAGHDTLTNLPNRTKFMNHLRRAVSRAEHNPSFRFAVLYLDLDRFKIINDSLGHNIGDKLLVAFAQKLEECLRPNDIVARLGGDEFTVLLCGIKDAAADASSVAERILEKLSVPFKLDTYEVFTSASIGIIVSDEVPRQPEDFLRDADTAMYRAKAAGKSRYEIFDREMHIRNMNLLQMENDLRRAIERKEFRVFYQPIIELNTGKVLEFEALIRWQHPQHGLIAPYDFICIAEETGLIIPIGAWILEEACRQTAEWQRRFALEHERLSVSVNLSAKQLLHPNIIAQLKGVLERTAFEPRFLKLEVTETMVMENGEKSLAVINDFHRLGVAVSTDDFGTGYSSLSYLHQFPFDRLKIDRSFVGKMEKDVKSEAIVRTILLLGQNLEIETVAEGIENEHQLARLRALGCRLGQGYYFSKPVDAASAEKLLEEGLTANIPAAENIFNYGGTSKERFIELDEVQ